MSSTDNQQETRFICGVPIRITYSVDVNYYGEFGQYMTIYWEGAELAGIPTRTAVSAYVSLPSVLYAKED